MKNIAIFASGSGTNAEKIMDHFTNHSGGVVRVLLSNKKDAYALKRAELRGVPTITFDRDDFYNSPRVIAMLSQYEIDLVVLAGFLWLIPENLVNEFPNRIINIHPALLPDYGGKGMYGMNVHEAVVRNKEVETGITIHYVNEKYDDGQVIFQTSCAVTSEDTPVDVAAKIHKLEHEHFPRIIEEVLDRI